MFNKVSIACMIQFSVVFAIKITFPSQPDAFICNQDATIECDTESSSTISMAWYLNDTIIAVCTSTLCTKYVQTPTHYSFTHGQSPFILSLNPAKMEDSRKSIHCKDTTTPAGVTSDKENINVEVEPTDSMTIIHYVIEGTVSLNVTACLYPVEDLVIRLTSKKGDSIRTLGDEQPSTGSSCESGSTDCVATSIHLEKELEKGTNPNNLYSVCIEILRRNESLLTKCTDQDIPLKVSDDTGNKVWIIIVWLLLAVGLLCVVIAAYVFVKAKCEKKGDS